MQANYPESIRRVLLSEGGYINHPSDPGGPTNFGITLAVYRANGHANATAADIKAMPLDEAKRIYRIRYANPCGFDLDPAGVDYALFDYAVNSGVSRANKVLRRVCALPDNAGFPAVLTALAKRDAKAVVAAINAERLAFLQSLKTWPVFGKGWGTRVKSVNAAALKMAASGAAAAVPEPVSTSQGKGEVPAPDGLKKIIAGSPPAVGAASGATWWDWVVAHPAMSAAIVVIGIIAIGAAIAALNNWHGKRQDAPTPGLIPVPEM